MPEMVHPVTGASASVTEDRLEWYESNGWVDATPLEFKDNSWPAVNPEAMELQRESEEAEQAEQPKAAKRAQAQPQGAGATTASDPNAAGVKADAGPSGG